VLAETDFPFSPESQIRFFQLERVFLASGPGKSGGGGGGGRRLAVESFVSMAEVYILDITLSSRIKGEGG